MNVFIFLSLLMLAINSILIQTIMVEQDVFKTGVRILVLGIIVFFITFVKKSEWLKLIVGLIILSLTLLIYTQNSDQFTLIFILITIQGLLLVTPYKVEKYLFNSSLISLGLIFLFLLLGITENEVIEYRNRMTFGISGDGGATFFINVVYGTLTLWIINSKHKFCNFKNKFTIYFVSVFAFTYFYIKTDVRGGYVAFLIFILLIEILPKVRKNKIITSILSNIPYLLFFFSFILATFHDNFLINEFFSHRPSLYNNFFSILQLSDILMSKSVKSFDTVSIVDNSYIHLFVGLGIITFCIIMFLIYNAIRKAILKQNYYEAAFLISTAIYFYIESLMVRTENMFVIYFWYLIIKYMIFDKIQNESRAKFVAEKS